MSDVEVWIRLARVRENCERLDVRLDAVRESIDLCFKRAVAWRTCARVRRNFRDWAARRGHLRLASTWTSLETEASDAAELDESQLESLELQRDQLELTLRAAWSDHQDLSREAEQAPALPALWFGAIELDASADEAGDEKRREDSTISHRAS